ncbi:uncharacterized protein Dsimw501_GD26939, isoform B [Drosophila simulans]|nr:uncharacterized protein Dsimw501_GD26939, isoform B [Drosophila simulans]
MPTARLTGSSTVRTLSIVRRARWPKDSPVEAVGDNCQSFPILPVARHWVHWAPGLSTAY